MKRIMLITIKQGRKIRDYNRGRLNVQNTEVSPPCEEEKYKGFRIMLAAEI